MALYTFCSPPLLALFRVNHSLLYSLYEGSKIGFSQYITVVKIKYFVKGILNLPKLSSSNMYLLTSIFFYFMSIYNNIVYFQFLRIPIMITFTDRYNNFSQGDALIDNINKYTKSSKYSANSMMYVGS